MAIAARIKSLDLRQLLVLSRTFMFHPLYLIPTYKGTKKTITICDAKFSDSHHSNDRSNAYRHALWNYLICEYCFKAKSSLQEALFWSKKITDLHEKLLPNDKLEKKMDLHNNKIGRLLFEEYYLAEPDILQILDAKMNTAIFIASIEDIANAGKELVYLEKLKK